MGSSSNERLTLRDPMAKFDAGAPPGPTETYIRTPTLLTRVTPPAMAGGCGYLGPQDAVLLAGRGALRHRDRHRVECLSSRSQTKIGTTERCPTGEFVCTVARSEDKAASNNARCGWVDRNINVRACRYRAQCDE